ncbi:MAG TPA: VanW family protein [Mycobacteriales bacterium]|nr:VanW family protein [Mycobacteriales bacterium]
MSSTVLPAPQHPAVATRSPGRTALAVGAMTLGVLGAVYAADVALARNEVPRGVLIAGLPLGGSSTDSARAELTAALADDATAPIPVLVDGRPGSVDPRRAGLSLDIDATLDRASSQALDPLSRVTSFFRTRRVDLVTRVDEAALRAEIDVVAKSFDRKAQEGAVRFEGITPVAILPVTGVTVEREGAAAAVYSAYLSPTVGTKPVDLPASRTAVRSTAEDVQRVLTNVAKPAVSAPVLLRSGATVLRLPPRVVARSLVLEAGDDGRILPVVDEKKLDAAVGSSLAPAEAAPRDAKFVVGPPPAATPPPGGPPPAAAPAVSIVPSVDGRKVDRAELARRLLPALERTGPARVVELPIVVAQPRITTARAQSLGIKEKIGEGTTFHPCCRPRVNNIHRMADIVDGAIVLPGETFSLNGFVGPRDRRRGFVEAPMILDGEFVDSVGGGVSQFATTMFNAVFFSGLKDVQHKPHSYYISRYPPGREATVSFPQPDLRWNNDSPHGVLVKTSYTGKSITVTFYGTKRFDAVESVSGPRTRQRSVQTEYRSGSKCESRGGAPGFDIVVHRIFKKGGKEVKRERFFTRYLMETRIICRRG